MTQNADNTEIWLVVADGEGCGDTRLVTGFEDMLEAVVELCGGDSMWRDELDDDENWMHVDGRAGKIRWRYVGSLGETGHLMVQRVDRIDLL